MIRIDEEIKKDIIDQLYWDSRVDASEITVEVRNGIVTLGGSVSSYFMRGSAVRDARMISGVTDVLDNIEVQSPTAATTINDGVLAQRLKDRLLFNTDVDTTDIDISVADNIVSLEGSVNELWKKYHVENIIASEPGIIRIENRIAVVPTGTYVDRDIAANITAALTRNTAIDEERVDVVVSDREVTFNGEVDSWSAREEAYETALYTSGVEGIHDNLKVVEATV